MSHTDVERMRSQSDAAEPVIETRALTKRYRHRVVVDRPDMRVPRGVVAGSIGPNGAGKTTTLRMLLGLVQPTSGTGRILGVSLTAAAAQVTALDILVNAGISSGYDSPSPDEPG